MLSCITFGNFLPFQTPKTRSQVHFLSTGNRFSPVSKNPLELARKTDKLSPQSLFDICFHMKMCLSKPQRWSQLTSKTREYVYSQPYKIKTECGLLGVYFMENRATWSVGVGTFILLHCICESTFLKYAGQKTGVIRSFKNAHG